MNTAKAKVITVLITIAATISLIAMLIGLTFQFVTLGKLKRDEKILNEEIRKISEYTPQIQDQIAFFENAEALEDYFRSQGYGKGSEIYFE